MNFFRAVLRFFDWEQIFFNIAIWALIELAFIAGNLGLMKDYVAHFVEWRLLLAQSLAILVFFICAVLAGYIESKSKPGNAFNAQTLATIKKIEVEIPKVPAFFAAALSISAVCKLFEAGGAMGALGDWRHWLINFSPAAHDMGLAFALLLFASLMRKVLG